MKRNIKIILFVILLVVGIVLIDTLQAKIFNNKPFLKIIENYNGGSLYQKDKGIFVDTYIFTNGKKKTVFKWEKYKNDGISNDYIAIFHGGSGEIIYETYIYKIKNGQVNRGFNYINVTKTTTFYGSSDWNTKITKHGSVEWTDNVFGVAKQNNAYSYVTLPNNDKIYTVEEYMKMFLMD